ncbi:MAG: potassium transporter Kup [Burkholderiaceae bacterium]|nr:potassium transporter Kup [Burkholderiaceae bacterium]
MASRPTTHNSGIAALALAAIGIVYGDIGTSPLYTMKTVFSAEHGLALNAANLLGIVSLIIWGLTFIVSLKYVTLILRADNRGEGGIMALMSLALSSLPGKSRWQYPLMLIGVFGATMFYGDSVITPAISVLSAIEGLEVAAPGMKPLVVPITVIVLVGLYAFQARGTAGIGKWFGPIMLVWFAALATLGVINIIRTPEILAALNPMHAFSFLIRNKVIAFIALGAVMLAFTGAEALYADMGHFGARPIRIAWSLVVFPALALNYLGQGGLLMSNPAAISNPFYQQLGAWSIYPLVALSTVATVIASQATISGTFSMTKQAISLGLLPRMKIIHTSDQEIGQIYMPMVNFMQFVAVVVTVIEFGSSDELAAAYGIAVTATMALTTILAFFVIHYHWKFNLAGSIGITGLFFVVDITLLSANTIKIFEGGWYPLLLGLGLFAIMMTWRKGRQLVTENLKMHAIPLEGFMESLFLVPPPRVPGTAIFLRGEVDGVPHAMLHNLKHNQVLHERVVFLTIFMQEVPWVPIQERIQIIDFGHECYQVNVQYGFKDEPDIPQVLELCREHGLDIDLTATSFFISRQTIISTPNGGMNPWREHLFVMLSRNARGAADYYRIPTNKVIELGTQIEI